MNISTWSIRSPIPALMLFILLTAFGLYTFKEMRIQNFPDIELPTVIVSAALPGAAPAQLETEVARKIENAVASLTGVKHIYSKVQDGIATVTAEFVLEKAVSDAVDDVRDAVSRVRADLPQDVREPTITKLELSGTPVLSYAISSDRMDEEALSWFVDNDLTKMLLSVKGVGRVSRVGGVQREVRVELDPQRLLALNATAADISRRLRQVQQDASGGRADIGGSEQSIRSIGTVRSAQELAALDIPLSDGRVIRLDEVASVQDTIAERRSTALLDGRQVVGFEISRSRGASEVTVAQGVNARLAELRESHPDLKVTLAFDMTEPVQESYDGSMTLLYEGALLAVIVVWFFLRDWRATLVAATALPLSIIPTFIGMEYMGFTLNVVTLLSMALVVGILVDDAIVEIENIVRHLGMGKSPMQAAMEAVEEIGLAVVATTATLVAVFLPTAFMSGIPGKFFKQFGWTAAIAVAASLLVARLLTPMMAAYLLKPIAHEPTDGWVMRTYLKWVSWCLRHRLITAIAAFAFFVGSLGLTSMLPSGFMPPDDMSQTQVTLELPPGSRFDETLRAAEQARRLAASVPDVVQIYSTVGGGAAGSDPFVNGGAPEARKATLLVKLTPRDSRKGRSKQDIESDLRETLNGVPGVRSTVGFGGAGEKLALALTGDDGKLLTATAAGLVRELRGIPGLGNITSSAALLRPEVVIEPDQARAADRGVTTTAIADTLRVATSGDYDQSLSKLNLPQRQIPIVVRLPETARQDLSLLRQLAVPGADGSVPLESVATLRLDSGPAVIDRYDRSRNVVINVELGSRELGDVLKEVDALPGMQALPPGVKRAELGDVEAMKDLFSSFGLAMLVGVVCIYIVLVLLFKDFLQPISILAALPLSIGGAFAALLIANKAMSMPSLIGLIMLMGIATKNSILLVEYAIVARRDHGLSRFDALVDACHKRARPIIMTTIAMGAGMLPIALGLGADPSFRSPMAIAVIGGLVTSTFLSLLVIPVVFTYVDDVSRFLHRIFLRKGQEVPVGTPVVLPPEAPQATPGG